MPLLRILLFLGLCDMVAWGRESLLKNFSQKKNSSLRTVQKKTIKTWIVSAKKKCLELQIVDLFNF